ncbi:hypothetical protein MCERE19_00200 [Spirosomataceae bacterium]|jgi:hypothetical protein
MKKTLLVFAMCALMANVAVAGTCTVTAKGYTARVKCNCSDAQACSIAKAAIDAVQ